MTNKIENLKEKEEEEMEKEKQSKVKEGWRTEKLQDEKCKILKWIEWQRDDEQWKKHSDQSERWRPNGSRCGNKQKRPLLVKH